MRSGCSRLLAASLALSLVLTSPGLDAWAAAGQSSGKGPGQTAPPAVLPTLPALPTPAAGLPAVPSTPLGAPAAPLPPTPGAAAPGQNPVVPVSAVLTPASAVLEHAAAAPGDPDNPSNPGAPGSRPAEQSAVQAGAAFDLAKPAPAAPAPVLPEATAGPAPDLKLGRDDHAAVAAFTSAFHDKASKKFRAYDFTERDFHAWARFLRFFAPSLGLRRALEQGARYVYGDRLESEDELGEFKTLLSSELAGLKLSAPDHGLDAKEASRLQALAEPVADAYGEDEESPFRIPLPALVPDKARAGLVLTPTTLRRLETAQQAFALRDYALLLGPPATQKSAVPKALAAELGIAHMAVTMHPGIGTYELVGGYRPRATRFAGTRDALRVIGRRLKEAEESSDYAELIEIASRVYGPARLDQTLKAVREDERALAEAPADESPDALHRVHEAKRRLVTLAHGLEFGLSTLVWQDGYLSYAIKRDIWITFEELNAAPTESQEFLNDFMRTRRLRVTEKFGEVETISPRPGGRFMLWATMNPETDPNREFLSQTLKNRWRVKNFGSLPDKEQAQVIESKYGVPGVWALALVKNFHKELRRLAVTRRIGEQWRDGYEINFRHLLRTAKRWRRFVNQEELETGTKPDKARQRFLLAREAFSVYGGMMRSASEEAGVFRNLDQALELTKSGVAKSMDELRVVPERIEDLGDRLRIADVVLMKGAGGPFVPKPDPDYLEDEVVRRRLYEYAKSLSMGEPLLLMGESSAGKTSDLEYLFFRANINLRYRNLNSDTAIEEVIGGVVPGRRRGEYVPSEGLLPRAMEERSGAFLDEFNLNPLVEWLNTVMDDGRLYLPHRVVEGEPYLVAAANPPSEKYLGRILLSPATRSRYTERWVARDASPPRLARLMGHWLDGGTIYTALLLFLPSLVGFLASRAPGLNALPRPSWTLAGLWARLAAAFRSKKKPALPAPPDEELALPPTLEDQLAAEGIPEAEWPAYRARVERLQTEMRMVGSAVSRDADLRWVPGALWAQFPGKSLATYPARHLITHTDAEIIGLVDHEALHREVTVLDERFPLVRKYMDDPVKHLLWNALEDPRVNSRGTHRLPGAEPYLHAPYDRYLPESIGDRPAATGPELDGAELEGDGAAAFGSKALEFPHVEFLMAANYQWRYGRKPSRFRNKSAEEAFDRALPDMLEVFRDYPQDEEPTEEEKRAHTLSALQRIDEKVLPLYEPLVKESQKKLAGRKSGKGKGKGKDSGGAPQAGSQGEPQPDPAAQAQAGREIENHAREAARRLGGQIKVNPTKQEAAEEAARRGEGEQAAGPGDGEPAPLTLDDVARTNREQATNREATTWEALYELIADLVNPLVTHLENLFQKNARARDIGYFDRGKRPHVPRVVKREGEGGVKHDVNLRRKLKTQRRYKVTLLVDESASMKGSRLEALLSVVLLASGLSRLQIDIEVIGFNDKARIHKPFGEPLTPEVKDRLVAGISEHLGNGNTHDADAVALALDRITREQADRRLLLVVTDGEGNGRSKLADVLPRAKAKGVDVIGVGVGEGMAYVSNSYPRHALVGDIAGLPLALRDAISGYVSEQERAAAEAREGPGRSALPSGVPPSAWLSRLFDGLTWRHALAAALIAASFAAAFAWPLYAAYPLAFGLSLLFALTLGNNPKIKAGYYIAALIAALLVAGLLGASANAIPFLMTAFAGIQIGRLAQIIAVKRGTLPWSLARKLEGIQRRMAPRAPRARPVRTLARDLSWQLLAERELRIPALDMIRGSAPAFAGMPDAHVLREMTGLLARADPDPAGRAAAQAAHQALLATQAAASQADPDLRPAPPAPVQAASDPAERGAAALSALDASTLAGRLRRAALEETLGRLAEARKEADAEAESLLVRRLEEQLAELPASASGRNALPRPRRPWVMAAAPFATILALILALNGAAYAATALLYSNLVNNGGLLFAGMVMAFILSGGKTTPFKRVTAGLALFLLASLTALSSIKLGVWPLGFGLMTILLLVATMPKSVQNMEQRLGVLPSENIKRLRALSPGDERTAAWLRALAGFRRERRAALAEMLSAPAASRPLLPAVALLLESEQQEHDPLLVALLEHWGDGEARQVLEELRLGHPVRAGAEAALARLRAGDLPHAELDALAAAAKAPEKPHAALRRRAAAALAVLPATLGERMRRRALEEALASLDEAVGAEDAEHAALAASRLEDLLAPDAAGAAPGRSALPRKLLISLPPTLLVAGPVLAAQTAGFLLTGLAVAVAGPFASTIVLGLIVFSIVSFIRSKNPNNSRLWSLGAVFGLSAFLAIGAQAIGLALAAAEFVGLAALLTMLSHRAAQALALSLGKPSAAIRGQLAWAMRGAALDAAQSRWLKALSGYPETRLPALAEMRRDPERARALWPALRTLPVDGDVPTIAGVVSLLEAWGDYEAELELSVLAGQPGGGEAKAALARLAARRRADAELAPLVAAARAEAGAAPEHAEIVARAQLAASLPASTLGERLRRAALVESLAAYRAAAGAQDPSAAALAAERLGELLAAADLPGAAPGRNALRPEGSFLSREPLREPWLAPEPPEDPAPPAFRPAWRLRAAIALSAAASAGASLAAIALGAGLPLAALWRASPVAGAAASGLAALFAALRLLRGMGTPPGLVQVAPAGFDWPVRDALAGLAARLGLAEPPRAGLYLAAGRGGRDALDAYSSASGLGREGLVAVGEAWVEREPEALSGVLGHELGHLYHKDGVWHEVLERLKRLAAWGAGLAFLAGLAQARLAASWDLALAALASAALLLGAHLAARAYSRKTELRADLFAAWAAGPGALRAFLAAVAPGYPPSASGWLGALDGLLSSHPPLDERRRAGG